VLIDKGGLPFFESVGSTDYVCICGATLVKGASEKYRFTELLFSLPQMRVLQLDRWLTRASVGTG